MYITDAKQIVNVGLMDADESAFFLRELESVKNRSYDTKYKNLKASSLIPVSTEGDPGAAQITYQSYSKVGIAKIVTDYADDIPRADVYGTEVSRKVYQIAMSYGYSTDEVRRSRMAGKGLEQRRADACKRGSDQKIDSIALEGDDDYDIPSFIDYPGISEYTVPNGTAGTATFSTKTAAEILEDLNGLVNSVIETTNGVEVPDTLLLPIPQYQLIAQTPRSTNSDLSILEYFLRNNPYIDMVDWLVELDGAGASATDRFMAYTRDPMHLTQELTLPYTVHPPQMVNLGFKIITEQKSAGTIVYYPLSVAFGDGI